MPENGTCATCGQSGGLKPAFLVRFRNEFDVIVEAGSEAEVRKALPKALEEVGSHRWGTGKWEAEIEAGAERKDADHTVEDGQIVAMEDVKGMGTYQPDGKFRWCRSCPDCFRVLPGPEKESPRGEGLPSGRPPWLDLYD